MITFVCRIVDITDPKERFVQVVRWYMSSFHAGRKSAVAKKPYNPILGEIFRCYWNFENHQQSSSDTTQLQDSESIKDGPIPWCTKDQLVFIAEQVSHHPPGRQLKSIKTGYFN